MAPAEGSFVGSFGGMADQVPESSNAAGNLLASPWEIGAGATGGAAYGATEPLDNEDERGPNIAARIMQGAGLGVGARILRGGKLKADPNATGMAFGNTEWKNAAKRSAIISDNSTRTFDNYGNEMFSHKQAPVKAIFQPDGSVAFKINDAFQRGENAAPGSVQDWHKALDLTANIMLQKMHINPDASFHFTAPAAGTPQERIYEKLMQRFSIPNTKKFVSTVEVQSGPPVKVFTIVPDSWDRNKILSRLSDSASTVWGARRVTDNVLVRNR